MSNPETPAFQAPPPPLAVTTESLRPTKLRPAAIVLFVLGLIVIVGGVAKFIPGGLTTGGALAFWGVLLFGLSFVPLPQPAPGTPEPMPVLSRVAGAFYEPSTVFKSLRAHPYWLAGFLIIAFLNIAYAVAFTQRLTPERIVTYVTDKMAETPFIPPEAVEKAKVQQLEQAKNPIERVGTAIKSMVGLFAFFAFLAALYLLSILVFGGRINYWQAFAVAVYASLPIAIIQRILSFIILYVKDPDSIHPIMGQETLIQDNLGVLFQPAQHPILFVAASAIGVLSFYGLWLKATGLRNGGEKVSSGAAWGTAILFWALGLGLALTVTAIFPSFIS